MRIHAASASDAVTRTLEAIITASGHSVCPLDTAELVLVDPLHPPPLPPTIATLVLEPTTLTHPIRPHHLLRMLVARQAIVSLTLGSGWQFDTMARCLNHPDSGMVSLTEKESALLATLASVAPAAIGREALLAQVWGMKSEIDTHTLETHIYRLRHKLGECSPRPCDIVTEDGAYKLEGAA